MLSEVEAPSGPLAAIQRASGEHIGPSLAKARKFAERVEVYLELLSHPDELLRGRATGGGGGTDGKFKPWDVTFTNYQDKEGASVKEPPKKGSHMVIDDGPGLIEAPHGFKIMCGDSAIEITPGNITLTAKTITLTASGPIKAKGSEILLNE